MLCLCQLILLLSKGKKWMQKINQTKKTQLMFIVWKKQESNSYKNFTPNSGYMFSIDHKEWL